MNSEENKSKSDCVLEHAYRKGYRVDNSGGAMSPSGKQMKTQFNTTGYLKFNVGYLGGSYPVRVHRLMAYQKFGARIFEPGIVVRHLNGNPLDNSFCNIAIGTYSDNYMDVPEHARLARSIHAASFNKTIDWNAVDLDRYNGASYKSLVETYGMSKGSLSRRYRGKYRGNKMPQGREL